MYVPPFHDNASRKLIDNAGPTNNVKNYCLNCKCAYPSPVYQKVFTIARSFPWCSTAQKRTFLLNTIIFNYFTLIWFIAERKQLRVVIIWFVHPNPYFSTGVSKDLILECKEVGRVPPSFNDSSAIAEQVLTAGYTFDHGKVFYNWFK